MAAASARKRRGREVVVHQSIVDLGRQLLVDEMRGCAPGPPRGNDYHLMDGQEGGIVLADRVLEEQQPLTGPCDGECQEDTEQEGGHAGQRDLHLQLAAPRAQGKGHAADNDPHGQ